MSDEIHEPTIARVRRDVVEYKCQAAWLDTVHLVRAFDTVRAQRDGARRRAERLSEIRNAIAEALGLRGYCSHSLLLSSIEQLWVTQRNNEAEILRLRGLISTVLAEAEQHRSLTYYEIRTLIEGEQR